jgi:hypothetical protein
MGFLSLLYFFGLLGIWGLETPGKWQVQAAVFAAAGPT